MSRKTDSFNSFIKVLEELIEGGKPHEEMLKELLRTMGSKRPGAENSKREDKDISFYFDKELKMNSFEAVWADINGREMDSVEDVVEILDKRIAGSKEAAGKMAQKQDIAAFKEANNEIQVYEQILCGIQGVPYYNPNGKRDNTDIWKAALVKGTELEKAQETQHYYQKNQNQGVNMAEVQEAERRASLIQGLNRSADGASRINDRETTEEEKNLLAAAVLVKHEAQAARTADNEARAQGNNGRQNAQTGPRGAGIDTKNRNKPPLREDRPLKNLQTGQRVTFRPHGEEGEKTELTGKVVASNEHVVTLRSGKVEIPVNRDKGDFFRAAPLSHEETKQHGMDHARELMGGNSKVYFAQENGKYEGQIIGLTPVFAIQKVNSETAILHRLKDLKPAGAQELLKEGQELSITKSEAGIFLAPLVQGGTNEKEREKVREQHKTRGGQSR